MPTYNDPVKGLSRSEALEEAAAVAPAGRAMLAAFELRHGGTAYARVVNDNQAWFFTHEDDAPLQPSQSVEYLAGSLEISVPEESDNAPTGEVTLKLTNVSGTYKRDMLDVIRGSLEPIYLTQRLYASDDVTGPAQLPVTHLIVTFSEITATTVTMKVSYGDPANIAVPRATFSRDAYPGLSR